MWRPTYALRAHSVSVHASVSWGLERCDKVRRHSSTRVVCEVIRRTCGLPADSTRGDHPLTALTGRYIDDPLLVTYHVVVARTRSGRRSGLDSTRFSILVIRRPP